MNRAEKRRNERLCVRTETPTLDDYIYLYTLSIAMALDSEELPKDQVLRIMDKLQETADCMQHNYINKRDVEQMCRETYGINFVDTYKKNIRQTRRNIIKSIRRNKDEQSNFIRKINKRPRSEIHTKQ